MGFNQSIRTRMEHVRIVYDLGTMRAVQVVDLQEVATTDFNSNFYGLLQGPAVTVEQQCSALGIANVDFSTRSIVEPLSNRDRVIMDRHFGQEILNEFLTMNKALPLTPEQDLAQLNAFAPIKAMLEVGGIRTARTLLAQVEVGDVFTQSTKDYFVAKMDNHLAS